MSHAPIDYLEVRYRIKDSGADWTVQRFAPNGFSLRGLSGGQTYEIEARNIGVNGLASEVRTATVVAPSNPAAGNQFSKIDMTHFASDTTNIDTITASVTFDKQTTSRRIFSSFRFMSHKNTTTNDGYEETKYGGGVTVEVSADGGAWTEVGTYGIAGTFAKYGEPGFTAYMSEAGGSITLTDSTAGTNLAYRARQSSGTMQVVSGATTTRYIEIKVEELP